MEELLQVIEEQTGVPADLIARSAAARAQAAGVTTEEILAAWSGGEVPTPAPAAQPPPAAAAPEPAPAAEGEAAPSSEGPKVEVLGPATGAAEGEEVGAADQEADVEPEPEAPAPTPLSGFPRWLAASFVILPTIAVLYAMLVPNAPDCGTAGQLAVDPVTGVAVNCDGTPYGVDIVNFFSIGQGIYEARCEACHGGDGGGGVGPALSGDAVLTTFPTCADHLLWVALGSEGWQAETGMSTYGATDKPVGGTGVLMPAFGAPVLTDEEVAAVVLYERVAFGGEPISDGEMGCGLVDENGETVASP